jgi:hypothetical protein
MTTRTRARLLPLLFTVVVAALVEGCGGNSHRPIIDGGGGSDGGGNDTTVDRPTDAEAKDLPVDQSQVPDGPSEAGDDDAGDASDGSDGSDGPADTGSLPVDAGPLTTVQSFTATVVITLTPQKGPRGRFPGPIKQEMTVRLDPVARTAVFSRPGYADLADLSGAHLPDPPLRAPPPGTFVLGRSFGLTFDVPDGCGSGMTVYGLTVVATAEELTAQGTGPAQVIFDHEYYRYDASFSLTGTRKTTGPTLGPGRTDVDPLEALALLSTEAITPAAVAHLKTSTEELTLVTGKAYELDLAVAFKMPAARALRYGTTYQLEVDPWRDLDGLAGQPLPTLTTAAAPELMPEDGFETAGETRGGAPVIAAPRLPPVTDTKSVMVAPPFFSGVDSRRFTVRLARQPGDTVLRATLRRLSYFDGSNLSPEYPIIRVAAPGGTIVKAQLPSSDDVSTRFDGPNGSSTVFLGTTRTLEVALPPSTGPEVVFDVVTAPPVLCGLIPPAAGYLIDDLRLE